MSVYLECLVCVVLHQHISINRSYDRNFDFKLDFVHSMKGLLEIRTSGFVIKGN